MKYWIYVLRSLKDKKLYVGCTCNLASRLKRHNNGFVNATKHRKPLTLIHSEAFQNKAGAFNRERFLKSLWGAREKKKILRKFLMDSKIV
ncbi:MAG: GIY-YIG nuclease family protein [bacterium]|nr:GIY-YIG nuclease family protein [bacterium]